MSEDRGSSGNARHWRRTERRTRAAKEIEQEIRRRERQRARRHAERGDGFDRGHLRCMAVLPLSGLADRPSYR